MNSKQFLFNVYIFVNFYMTEYLCLPCDSFHAWKCPNDNLCLHQWYEVCVPPPYNIQRCPNGGDYGNDSCTQERCQEVGHPWPPYVKCPNSPHCVRKNDIDSKCPKDKDDEKNGYQVKCDSDSRNCTCPSETNQTTSCSSFCQRLKLTKDEIMEYGEYKGWNSTTWKNEYELTSEKNMTFVKCQVAKQSLQDIASL